MSSPWPFGDDFLLWSEFSLAPVTISLNQVVEMDQVAALGTTLATVLRRIAELEAALARWRKRMRILRRQLAKEQQ